MLTLAKAAVNRNDCESLKVSKAIIEFCDVKYQINTRDSRSILAGVSLEIHQGETIALLGRSGSGKTTMLKLINRMRTCTSGDLRVGGTPIRDWDHIASAAPSAMSFKKLDFFLI